MRGRKPKPTALKVIEGNPGKRPLNHDEPQAAGELIEAPDDLSDDQRAIWEYAIAHAPKGVLRMIDRDNLRAWVVAADLHRKATAEVQARGILSTGAEGQLVKNPAVMVLRDATAMMMRAAEQMGFSPTARARIKVPEKPNDPKNPWEKLKTQ